jgi:hypothetical protein
VTLVRGGDLRERVCAEKLVGPAQEFTYAELEDPILRGIDKDDPIARNPMPPARAAVPRLLDAAARANLAIVVRKCLRLLTVRPGDWNSRTARCH